jgi:hypothetical protein
VLFVVSLTRARQLLAMTTPQTISVWFTCITSNFEHVGRPFLLVMPIEDRIALIPTKAKERYPTSLRDVDESDLEVWKMSTPAQHPARRYKTRTSKRGALTTLQHADGTRSGDTFENFLENIRSSSILDHAELLDDREKLIDCFEEDPEDRIQGFVLWSGIPPAVTLVRLL